MMVKKNCHFFYLKILFNFFKKSQKKIKKNKRKKLANPIFAEFCLLIPIKKKMKKSQKKSCNWLGILYKYNRNVEGNMLIQQWVSINIVEWYLTQ